VENLEHLGLDSRFFRTLNNVEKKFFEDNFKVIPDIIESIKEKYQKVSYVQILTALRRISYFDEDYSDMYSDFEIDVYNIVKSEIRNHKLKSILTERKVYYFSDFINSLK
jgi:hypothetical protein